MNHSNQESICLLEGLLPGVTSFLEQTLWNDQEHLNPDTRKSLHLLVCHLQHLRTVRGVSAVHTNTSHEKRHSCQYATVSPINNWPIPPRTSIESTVSQRPTTTSLTELPTTTSTSHGKKMSTALSGSVDSVYEVPASNPNPETDSCEPELPQRAPLSRIKTIHIRDNDDNILPRAQRRTSILQTSTYVSLPFPNVTTSSSSTPGEPGITPCWSLLGQLWYRYKSGAATSSALPKWQFLPLCGLFTATGRLLGFRSSRTGSQTPSLSLCLLGYHPPVFAGRENDKEFVFKITHPSLEACVLAGPTLEQAMEWIQQIALYSVGHTPQYSRSFLVDNTIPETSNLENPQNCPGNGHPVPITGECNNPRPAGSTNETHPNLSHRLSVTTADRQLVTQQSTGSTSVAALSLPGKEAHGLSRVGTDASLVSAKASSSSGGLFDSMRQKMEAFGGRSKRRTKDLSLQFRPAADCIISGMARICISQRGKWCERLCQLRPRLLEVYALNVHSSVGCTGLSSTHLHHSMPHFDIETSTVASSASLQSSNDSSFQRDFILSLENIQLEFVQEKKHRYTLKLSSPEANGVLLFEIPDKRRIAEWIRGFIQAIGHIRDPAAMQQRHSSHGHPTLRHSLTVMESSTGAAWKQGLLVDEDEEYDDVFDPTADVSASSSSTRGPATTTASSRLRRNSSLRTETVSTTTPGVISPQRRSLPPLPPHSPSLHEPIPAPPVVNAIRGTAADVESEYDEASEPTVSEWTSLQGTDSMQSDTTSSTGRLPNLPLDPSPKTPVGMMPDVIPPHEESPKPVTPPLTAAAATSPLGTLIVQCRDELVTSEDIPEATPIPRVCSLADLVDMFDQPEERTPKAPPEHQLVYQEYDFASSPRAKPSAVAVPSKPLSEEAASTQQSRSSTPATSSTTGSGNRVTSSFYIWCDAKTSKSGPSGSANSSLAKTRPSRRDAHYGHNQQLCSGGSVAAAQSSCCHEMQQLQSELSHMKSTKGHVLHQMGLITSGPSSAIKLRSSLGEKMKAKQDLPIPSTHHTFLTNGQLAKSEIGCVVADSHSKSRKRTVYVILADFVQHELDHLMLRISIHRSTFSTHCCDFKVWQITVK